MDAKQPFFTEDSQQRYFPATFYIAIGVELIALIVSVVALVAFLIPLLRQLQNGSFYRDSLVSSSMRRRRTEAPYSTYNLYLVYLCLIDIAGFLPMMVSQFMATTQTSRFIFHRTIETFQPFYYFEDGEMKSVEGLVTFPYGVANLWINSFIAHQVLVLLKRSHCGQKNI